MLARVVGQDLEHTDDGVFRMIRGTATDRVISTVDPDARHGHKSSACGYDGYKGHVAVDPDSEIITDTQVTAGNAGDASVAADLIDDLTDGGDGGGDRGDDADGGDGGGGPVVYGDAAYGAGEFLGHLADAGVDTRCKTQPPPGRRGRFSKDAFDIDLDDDTVTCPAGTTVGIRRNRHGDGEAAFGAARTDCPLRPQCTDAAGGRTVAVTRYERHLATARRRQRDPDWQADYRATRPKVERKIGHLMRRRPADDEHACAAAPARSTPTSTCSPPRSTSRAWPSSGCATSRPAAGPQPPEHRHRHVAPTDTAPRRWALHNLHTQPIPSSSIDRSTAPGP